MTCKKCGSDWTTKDGSDCKTCPHCCKLQRCKARKEGRWIEPTQQKTCEECGVEFTAVGLHDIAIQVTCKSTACKAARNKRNRRESAERRAAGVYTRSRDPKPERHCKFSGCGKKLTRRDQKDYCGKPCYFAAIDAGEQQFKGRVQDEWARFVDWAYDWDSRPYVPPKGHDSKLYKPRPSCEVCGKECNYRYGKFCSKECCKLWRGPRKCKCGSIVDQARAYCRPSCVDCKRKAKAKYRRYLKQQIGTYRKRCRKYGGYYNAECKRKAILERDDYVCHMCGRKCRNGSDYNHARAATVDHHPVPLSKGGDHDWCNVRCACRSCNSKKSDMWDGQRRLSPLRAT